MALATQPIDETKGGLGVEKTKRLDVFTIIDQEGAEKKSIWIKIGVAFVNRDESLSISLNALPTNGRLHVRETLNKNQ